MTYTHKRTLTEWHTEYNNTKHNVQMHLVTHRNCLFLGEEEEEEEENEEEEEEEREAVSF